MRLAGAIARVVAAWGVAPGEVVDVGDAVADMHAAAEAGVLGVAHPAPGFARLSRGGLHLLVNRPGAGGAGQAMPDGQVPASGGWNRIQLEVADLATTVDRLRADGCRFRSEIVTGNGGRQILVEDPSGNPIELFEPFSPDAPSPARRTS